MKISLALALLFFAMNLSAQKFSISGNVADATGSFLPGAVVALKNPTGEILKNSTVQPNGNFILNEVEKGDYLLEISFLGLENFTKNLTLATGNLDLGQIVLADNSLILNQIEVKEKTPIAVQRGDTTEMNSNAFKVLKDADAQDLIQKMPGMTVENGQLSTQGEKVQRVLVDGKPFFGDDATAALKNLPAEVIEKVQIFDAQTDQSQFTGISDGNTTKTINIVTKPGMKNGQFGKIYAGFGLSDASKIAGLPKEKYQAGGNINFFDGNRRISFLGLTNNINQQNFAVDDILGATGSSGGGNRGAQGGQSSGRQGGGGNFGGGGNRSGGGGTGDFLVNPSGGIATTHAIGINYTDSWGKKTEVTGSYFFNNSNTVSEKITVRQFLTGTTGNEIYDENDHSEAKNTNHRVNFRVEIKADSLNSFILRPRLTLQKNNGESKTVGQTITRKSKHAFFCPIFFARKVCLSAHYTSPNTATTPYNPFSTL